VELYSIFSILSAVLIKSIGEDMPLLANEDCYLLKDIQDLLVNIEHFAYALAKTMLTPTHNASPASTTEPDRNLVF